MTRTISALLLGACALATAHTAMRLIAPWAGLGLTLYVAVLVTSLAGFAFGAMAGTDAESPEAGRVRAARALLGTAALTLAVAFARRPLLELAGPLEVRMVVAITSLLFAGLPCAGLGFAFASTLAGARGAETTRAFGGLLLGAALAAPLAGFVLVPRLGLTLALVVVAVIEAFVALGSGVRRAPLSTGLGVLFVLVAGGVLVARPAKAFGPRMLEVRQGLQSEYRVFDRDGARYLVVDGTIHAVMDTLSGDCVQRGPAALALLKIFHTGRDSMLVLGLRGGTLPLAFARSGWRVRVVEPDSDAAAVAKTVAYRPGELELVSSDARRFVRADRSRYSVIVVDAFGGSEIPPALCSREFVRTLAPRLTPDGLVVVSVEAHGWGDPLVQALAATLRTAFAHVQALPTSEPQNALGTILLVASPAPLPLTDEQLPNPTTFFQNPDALWAVQQQLHAWLNRYEPQAGGAMVLTDDRSMVEVWADRVNHAARKELHTFFGPRGGSW